jgi:hypothetical protein
MARVAHAAGFRSNSGNGIIAGFQGPFFGYFSFGRLEKKLFNRPKPNLTYFNHNITIIQCFMTLMKL